MKRRKHLRNSFFLRFRSTCGNRNRMGATQATLELGSELRNNTRDQLIYQVYSTKDEPLDISGVVERLSTFMVPPGPSRCHVRYLCKVDNKWTHFAYAIKYRLVVCPDGRLESKRQSKELHAPFHCLLPFVLVPPPTAVTTTPDCWDNCKSNSHTLATIPLSFNTVSPIFLRAFSGPSNSKNPGTAGQFSLILAQLPAAQSTFTQLLNTYFTMNPGNHAEALKAGAELITHGVGYSSQVREIADRGITLGNVTFEAASKAASLAAGVFSIISIAVGQHHLSQINDQLCNLATKVDDIYDMLIVVDESAVEQLLKELRLLEERFFELLSKQDAKEWEEWSKDAERDRKKGEKLRRKLTVLLQRCFNRLEQKKTSEHLAEFLRMSQLCLMCSGYCYRLSNILFCYFSFPMRKSESRRVSSYKDFIQAQDCLESFCKKIKAALKFELPPPTFWQRTKFFLQCETDPKKAFSDLTLNLDKLKEVGETLTMQSKEIKVDFLLDILNDDLSLQFPNK